MNPPTSLAGAHLRTYQTIFQHPVSHNLGWRDVHALLRHLGQVEEEPNGNLKVIRNGQTLVLPPSRTKDVSGAGEVMKLRSFLEKSERAATDTVEPEARCLVVINHHEARLFRSVTRGTVAEEILPHAPEDIFRAPNSKDFARGGEKPDPNSFFPLVAKALKGTKQILIFGSGTGMANEMDQFVAWLKVHHPELDRRVAGSLIVDEHHTTDAQLLAKARDFFANPPALAASTL